MLVLERYQRKKLIIWDVKSWKDNKESDKSFNVRHENLQINLYADLFLGH